MRVLYFAAIRDSIGVEAEDMDLPPSVVTASDLADLIEPRCAAIADRRRLRVAIDRVMAPLDSDVRHAEEVAFFPPVTGG